MLAFPGLMGGELGPQSYQEIQTKWDGLTAHGAQEYLKSGFLNELTPEVIEIMVDFVNRGETTSWCQHLGGATSRVTPDATAFAHRNVALNYGPNYPRLVEIKNQYDPTNLFRLNANIRPTV